MDNLLEVRNLKVNFRIGGQELCAVKDASFSVGFNETVVLAGESGSGKTVSCLAVTRILPANAGILSGQVYFRGRDLLLMEEKDLVKVRGRQIAYIFQEPASYLNPVMTIGDQIVESILLHREMSKRQAQAHALELLAMVRIQDPKRVYFDYPHQLSGGMNQRAFIAMSIACKPALLIADEPTTALDVTIEAQILELLGDLKKQFGFSLLFITHNLSIAKRIASKVFVMYRGQVVEHADTSAIFLNPVHEHTKELIAAYEKIGRL